jgi:DNA-binding NarL/FixJ family response regulator
MQPSPAHLETVILDPHPIWRDAVEAVLSRVGALVVVKTSSGREALAAVEDRAPGLLTLELETPPGEPNGYDVLRRAKEIRPELRAIVLSARHDTATIDAALAAGADAYVVKTARPEDVALAVRQTVGQPVLGSPSGSQPSRGRERPGSLTRREVEILRLVAEGHSNSQLARMLWVTEQTIKFHLSNVYKKLGVANRTEASRWAQLNGLLSHESPDSLSA